MEIRDHIASGKPALILARAGTVIDFAELEKRANRLAHFWYAAGLREGDTVAAILENNEHVHAVMWAARRSGLYYALINTHLTVAEAAYIVDNSSAKALIGSRATRSVCEGLAEHLPGELPELLLIADDDLDGWYRYPECVADQPETPIPDEREGDLLQYSSGTTGRPKGIRRELPHLPPSEAPNIVMPLMNAVGITSESVYLSPAPLVSHRAVVLVYGGAVAGRHHGRDGEVRPGRRARVHPALRNHARPVRPRDVRADAQTARSGAQLLRRFQLAAGGACGCAMPGGHQETDDPVVGSDHRRVLRLFGSGRRPRSSAPQDWLDHPGSVGRPLVGVPHILDENGQELPAGAPGEIYYEGGYSFEYLKDDAKTAAAHDTHGWVTVGDIGYLDADGYLYLTDRRHHMIISGGVNIYPQEAEDLLITHPKMLDAAVFGIPDDEMGQAVKGVVQTVDPADANDGFAAELLDWLRNRLAHYKCPRSLSFEAQLPRTDTGKLYKQQLVGKYSPTG